MNTLTELADMLERFSGRKPMRDEWEWDDFISTKPPASLAVYQDRLRKEIDPLLGDADQKDVLSDRLDQIIHELRNNAKNQ